MAVFMMEDLTNILTTMLRKFVKKEAIDGVSGVQLARFDPEHKEKYVTSKED